ncbi:MAG: hypothetical protein ACRD22_18770, partial [Terriglobia bacterium]
AGNIAILQWSAIAAGADSSVSWGGVPSLAPNFTQPTQAARGAEYAKYVQELLNFKVDAGNGAASGQYPLVGLQLWDGGADDPTGNWGLTTGPNDNAYDGYADRQAIGTDAWGYPTGGETGNYGNFLGPVSNANRLWLGLIPRTLVKTSSAP